MERLPRYLIIPFHLFGATLLQFKYNVADFREGINKTKDEINIGD